MPPERRIETGSPTEVVAPPLTEGTEPLGAPAQEALPTGTVLESRFRVVRMLGRGGMGEVYEAIDVALGTRIAVKTVRLEPGSTEVRLQRFRREILLARRVSHPNVSRVFELHLGNPGEPPLFLSMELLEGETLAERLRRDGPLPEPVARELVTQIASGLAAAHREGVLHRDLKPSNVMLVPGHDGSERAVVTDFGIARAMDGLPAATTWDGPIGTPAYMAPEQVAGRELSPATDLYSLGVLMTEMATGTLPASPHPADGSDGAAAPLEPGIGKPPAHYGRSWKQLCRWCLEIDPSRRPQSAEAFLRALRHRAPPLRRPMQRLLLSVALVMAALGGIVVVIHRAAPDQPGPPLIAVADFANETGDPDLDGIGSLVATALQESPGLRVLTRSRMVDLQRQLGTDVAVRVDESTGREIARRAGARTLLAGSVRRMGELIVVELRGIDPDRGEYLLSDREQGKGKSEVLALIDRLAARARKKLVGDRGPSTGATPVAQLVTANLEANRWYETGRSLEEQGLDGAQEAYRKAIALDPEFALAHFALAAAASRARASVSELGAIATTAIKVAGRAPWREARLIRAWNATVEQHVDDARALYREVLERYPDDKEVLTLGASVAASPEETLAYLQRALHADPMYVPAQLQIGWAMCDLSRRAELIPLARTWLAQPPAPGRAGAAARAFMAAGELDNALEAARRDDLLSPGASALEAVHMARREYREAERVARERIARSGRGQLPLANALTYQGRRREALAVLAGVPPPTGSVGYANIASGDAPAGELRARIRELVAAQPLLDWLGAMTLAVAGDVPGAEGYARALPREGADPPGGVFSDEMRAVRLFVQALAARARGDAVGGRAMLRELVAWRRWKVRTVAAFSLGQACAEDGDLECAVAALRQYRAEPLPGVIYRPWMLPRSARLLAEVLERQGKADEARRLVEGFLRDWRDADPDLLDLTRARALCERLHCQPAPKPTVTR